jgi:hypothetical protein
LRQASKSKCGRVIAEPKGFIGIAHVCLQKFFKYFSTNIKRSRS